MQAADFPFCLINEKTRFTELIRRFDRSDFDLVAVGRGLLQDPQRVEKVKEGRFDELKDFIKII